MSRQTSIEELARISELISSYLRQALAAFSTGHVDPDLKGSSSTEMSDLITDADGNTRPVAIRLTLTYKPAIKTHSGVIPPDAHNMRTHPSWHQARFDEAEQPTPTDPAPTGLAGAGDTTILTATIAQEIRDLNQQLDAADRVIMAGPINPGPDYYATNAYDPNANNGRTTSHGQPE